VEDGGEADARAQILWVDDDHDQRGADGPTRTEAAGAALFDSADGDKPTIWFWVAPRVSRQARS
jgi:hypothetical protein